MTDSALRLQDFLHSHGISAWVCVQMSGGTNYREAIVDAVKNCKVFLPLINNEWALSGECEDEYSLAKRLNLTSHERGQTQRAQPREPVLVPIAFPNLNWTAHKHVELLAAKTNFIVHNTDNLLTGNVDKTLSTLLLSLAASGLEIQNAPEQLALRIEAFKLGTNDSKGERLSDQDRLADVHSKLESLVVSVQEVLMGMSHTGEHRPQRVEAQESENDSSPKLGKEYLGVITCSNFAGRQEYWYADSTHITFEYDPAHNSDSVPLSGTIVQKELRKLVNGQEVVEDSNPLASWVRERKTMTGALSGTWLRQSGFVTLEIKFENTMDKKAWFNVLHDNISGVFQVIEPHQDKADPYCTAGLTLKQVL
eukprot:c33604_g1_i1.p1 GENE.c33604_g1_i1~~c33604_g1_i1.p1  ORF type:complete len:395 (+),score=94.27 c33604_g1_i1:90-1187(+)